MARTKIDYGIDLGTTNSAIVRMESGEPKIKKTDTLKDTMPSCVYFNKKKSISIGDSGPMVNDANIIHTDIEAFNGVIHVIDEVLVPAGYPGATTWDVIVQSPEHTILEQALLAENLINIYFQSFGINVASIKDIKVSFKLLNN